MVKRNYGQHELLEYVERDKDTQTLEGKEILMHFDSFCLGDTICFSSYIDTFLEFHKPKKVIISTFLESRLKSSKVFSLINFSLSLQPVISFQFPIIRVTFES